MIGERGREGQRREKGGSEMRGEGRRREAQRTRGEREDGGGVMYGRAGTQEGALFAVTGGAGQLKEQAGWTMDHEGGH